MKINGKTVKAEVVSTFCEETSQLLKAETFFAVESECQSPPYNLTPETQAKLDRLEEDVHYFHLRCETDSGTIYNHDFRLPFQEKETVTVNRSIFNSDSYDIDVPSKNESVLLGLADRVNASDKEFDIEHWYISRYVYGSKDWQRYGEAELIDFERRQREIENDPYSRLDSVVETYDRL